VLGGEATNTDIIIFGRNYISNQWSTSHKYANYYTTNVVHGLYKLHQKRW